MAEPNGSVAVWNDFSLFRLYAMCFALRTMQCLVWGGWLCLLCCIFQFSYAFLYQKYKKIEKSIKTKNLVFCLNPWLCFCLGFCLNVCCIIELRKYDDDLNYMNPSLFTLGKLIWCHEMILSQMETTSGSCNVLIVSMSLSLISDATHVLDA